MAGFGFGTNIASEGIFQLFKGRGKKPDVPEKAEIDLGKVLSGLIKISTGNLPEINELVSAVNLFVSDEAQRLAERFVPGFTATQAAQMGAARDLSEGRLPKPVLEALRSEGAARNIDTGTLASARVPEGFANFRHLFRTGQEALQGIGFGSQLASQATARARAFAPDFASPFSFLFSPAQALEAERFNEQSRFQTELAENIRSAMPSPSQLGWATAAQADFDQTLSTVASGLTGGALGGMGGMMGGMGGGMGGGGGASTGPYYDGSQTWARFLNIFGVTPGNKPPKDGGGGGGGPIY